ncbi:hypothetical protein DFH28DRAFT_1191244 [Melampsora americana]|nr:hypothetical protein DFH28DRAFT_1191244 [Melampsora americana]
MVIHQSNNTFLNMSESFLKKRLRRKFGNVMGGGRNGGDEDVLHLIRNEVAIMKKVQHPNIVKSYEVIDVEGEDSLYMVMEYDSRRSWKVVQGFVGVNERNFSRENKKN